MSLVDALVAGGYICRWWIHLSLVDTLVVGGALPTFVSVAGKKEAKQLPSYP